MEEEEGEYSMFTSTIFDKHDLPLPGWRDYVEQKLAHCSPYYGLRLLDDRLEYLLPSLGDKRDGTIKKCWL